jgi:hypothetical protein
MAARSVSTSVRSHCFAEDNTVVYRRSISLFSPLIDSYCAVTNFPKRGGALRFPPKKSIGNELIETRPSLRCNSARNKGGYNPEEKTTLKRVKWRIPGWNFHVQLKMNSGVKTRLDVCKCIFSCPAQTLFLLASSK